MRAIRPYGSSFSPHSHHMRHVTSGFMRLCNITEKGRMVAQSGIVTAMCNRYSVDITPVTHVISQGCNTHAHDIPVGTVILHPAPYTIVPGPGRDTRHPPHYHHPAA